MWFHHPSQALPLTATVPRLPNGMERKAGRAYRSVLDLVVANCTAALAGAMSVVPLDRRRVLGSYRARRDRVLIMCSARMSNVGVKGATCDLSELDLRSQRRRVVSGAQQMYLLCDMSQHLLCDAVHSAGSQLPLEGTERDNSAQMVKIKVL